MAKSKSKVRQPQKRKAGTTCEKLDGKTKRQKLDKIESCSKISFNDLLLSKFGVQMPDDFYYFWDFVSQHLDILEECRLVLLGPYDLVNGKISASSGLSVAEFHLHGRHYFDPPEVMSVIGCNDGSGFHIGYFRDSPHEPTVGLVWNKVSSGGVLHASGSNIFAAVADYCQSQLRSALDKNAKKAFSSLLDLVRAEANRLHYALTTSLAFRFKKIQASTFHKFGISVPVDSAGVGYRELPISDGELSQLLTQIDGAKEESEKMKLLDELQEIITLVHFANDECDYGMGLELGLDLFTHGSSAHHGAVQNLLSLAYQLLQRDLYGEVIELHLACRCRDFPVDKNKTENS